MSGQNRLQYLLASGLKVLYVSGRHTAPFVAWQLAAADCGMVSDAPAASSGGQVAAYLPADSLVPVQISESRFSTRGSTVCVHRTGRPLVQASVDANLGPQGILEHLLAICGLRGSFRLSFPAVMPAESPCLHVVLHQRDHPVPSRFPCLLDLRRVRATTACPEWGVILLPPSCCLADVQACLSTDFPSLQPYSAVYVNYGRLLDRPVALHRHSVVTLLGPAPLEGLDTVLGNGSFAPLCYRGNDVAATRPGLARFLAFPCVPDGLSTTSTSTTCPSNDEVTAAAAHFFGLEKPGVDLPPDSVVFTVFDAEHGYRTFHATMQPVDDGPLAVARRAIDPAGEAMLRVLTHEVVSLPSPQIAMSLLSPETDRRLIVFDLTPFGGDITAWDVVLGHSVFDALAEHRPACADSVVGLLHEASCVCLVNHIVAAPSQSLGRDAEVVHFYLLRNAAVSGPS